MNQTYCKVWKRNRRTRSSGPQLTFKLSFDQGYNSKKPWRWKTSDMLWFILSICLRILKVIHKLIHLIKSSLYLCRNFLFRQRLPFVTALALSVAIAFDAFMKPSVIVEAAPVFLAMIMGPKLPLTPVIAWPTFSQLRTLFFSEDASTVSSGLGGTLPHQRGAQVAVCVCVCVCACTCAYEWRRNLYRRMSRQTNRLIVQPICIYVCAKVNIHVNRRQAEQNVSRSTKESIQM